MLGIKLTNKGCGYQTVDGKFEDIINEKYHNFNQLGFNELMMKTIEHYTYKINENIGKGFSSTVHKGVDDKSGRPVSIKVIEMIKLEDPINQMLLENEIMALKVLTDSPHVLHLYDVYATKNNTYIITELCDGDLGSVLKRRRFIAYPEAIDILGQIIEGYTQVSRSGYLHRDIKPANIFFRGSRYKIGDFGFAIPRQELDKHSNYNVGSPVYMPPEALKDNLYSPSCDTWAIGIIFYQMIKGVVPWRAVSEQKLHEKLITEPLDTLTTGLPEVARQFLSRVLCLDPKARINVEDMKGWCSRLASVDIVEHGPRPLRQLRNENPNIRVLPPSNKQDSNPNKVLTLKENVPKGYGDNFIPLPAPLTQKKATLNFEKKEPNCFEKKEQHFLEKEVQSPFLNEILIQETVLKETEGFARNIISYLKFLHKILNFMAICPSINVGRLTEAIKKTLLEELHLFDSFMLNPSKCVFDHWAQFLQSSKGEEFRKKFEKAKNKYKMMHSTDKGQQPHELNDEAIKDGLRQLMEKLAVEETSCKMIVAADYLTTMLQLWRLRGKFNLVQFFQMSKIDLIVQGEPYAAGREHLTQLRRKISLIGIFE